MVAMGTNGRVPSAAAADVVDGPLGTPEEELTGRKAEVYVGCGREAPAGGTAGGEIRGGSQSVLG